MKKFLKYIALFSIIIIATLGIGEMVVRHLPNSYSIKNQYIEENGDSITTVILGSSHTYFGVIADSLGPNTVNLANVSQNYEYDFRLLRHYLPEMPRLRKVLVPVSYFSLFDPPFEKGGGKENETFYRLYMNIDKYSLLSPKSFELYNTAIYSGKLRNALTGKRHGVCSPQGFGLDFRFSDRESDWKHTASEHAEGHTAKSFEFESYNSAWLDSLLILCSDNNITVDLITTPVWKGYRDRLNPTQVSRMKRIVDKYVSIYSLTYHDFSSDSRFGEDDFYDADHLADTGAEKFTRILQDTCRL